MMAQWERFCLPVQEMQERWVRSLGREDPLEKDDGAGMAKRSYPTSEVRGSDERSYPESEVRGGGREEIPHAPSLRPGAAGGRSYPTPPCPRPRVAAGRSNPRSKELWLRGRRRA